MVRPIMFAGLLFLTGCYNYRNIRVEVIDAQNSKPMALARVRAIYPVIFAFPMPRGGVIQTDVNGVATLSVADKWQGVMIHVSAPGHESNSMTGYAIANVGRDVLTLDSDPVATIRVEFFKTAERPKPQILPHFPSPSNSLSLLVSKMPFFHGQSRAQAVAQLGSPATTRKFNMSDPIGEFQIELYNTYPPNQPGNAKVEIEEMAWKDGDYWITLWLHQKNGSWVILDSCRWHKDVVF